MLCSRSIVTMTTTATGEFAVQTESFLVIDARVPIHAAKVEMQHLAPNITTSSKELPLTKASEEQERPQ